MEVNILKFDHFGNGISKDKDKVIFVKRALPNEIVDIVIKKEKKHFLEAEINKIIKKSNDRQESICPYYHKCGGCQFLHTTYEVEKAFKINKGKELLGNVNNFYETKKMNYRNKVTLHIKNNQLGYYEEGSNKLLPINYCFLLDDKINKVINELNKFDLSKAKKIIIRVHQEKILLYIDGTIDEIDKLSKIDTIIMNNQVIKGKGYLEEVIDGKIFRITKEAFFQVNYEGLINIYEIIKSFFSDKKINNALDLYSGTALWSILISNLVNKVTAIESNKEACDNALINLKNNNIENIKVINGKVEDFINQFQNIDLIIVDPPRSGLDGKTVDYLKKISSQYIIYISCDMLTLQRDLISLKDNYDVKEVNLVDMFKRTYHCESIVILKRK